VRPLLIRDETGAWRTPETSRFDNEGGLQDLVASNPSLLPLVGEGAVADDLIGRKPCVCWPNGRWCR
jgi:hypothetical protein